MSSALLTRTLSNITYNSENSNSKIPFSLSLLYLAYEPLFFERNGLKIFAAMFVIVVFLAAALITTIICYITLRKMRRYKDVPIIGPVNYQK